MPRRRVLAELARSKATAVACAVVAGYALIALGVASGLLFEPADSRDRVGPSATPGCGARSFEERWLEADFHLARFERVQEHELADLALAELRPAPEPAEELRAVAARGRAVQARAGTLLDGAAQSAELALVFAELESVVGELYAPLAGADLWRHRLRRALGTDHHGRSIAVRAVHSIETALVVGSVVALVSVLVGGLLGAAAAYHGGWVDHVVVWLYSTLSSIPHLVLLIALSYAFLGGPFDHTLVPVFAALCATFWIRPCRVVRAKTFEVAQQEYVQAARAIGFGGWRILLRHVLPNTAHLLVVELLLLFVSAVKAEVVLSFLGLGVKSQPSWGIMLRESRPDLANGSFWQLGAATAGMAVLVLAASRLCDALQDAFDPKRA